MRAVWLAVLLAGCPEGDSLVVVTVDANPAIANVALLHTTSTAGGTSIVQDVGATAAPFSIGGGVTKTFGVQVPASITGTFSIHIDAEDAGGKKLAQGDGTITLMPGSRVDLTVKLGSPSLLQPVYVGGGGSASSATQQLNVNIGGSDTVGVSTAASGASFQAGFFPTQAY